MKSLNETIQTAQERLDNPDLTHESRQREEANLHHLKSLKHLLSVIHDDMIPGKKFCWRYGCYMVEQCEVCESCLAPEDLAWNEGDE